MTTGPAWHTVLRALREASGRSQQSWATRIGYSRRTVLRWEQGDSAPDAAAEAAIVTVCAELGLLRGYDRGPLAGLLLTPELLHAMLVEARLAAATTERPSIATVARRANALPAALTSLVGREEDVAALGDLLMERRLVTVTGPGGVGKTRLATEAARAASPRFADGVVLVDLAPLTDPELVPLAIAQALGIPETAGQPLLTSLRLALHGKALLLVLDNFEHVAAAGPPLADLLTVCPRLRALITSRMALRLSGEREYAVAPLPLPAPSATTPDAVQSPAVDLFVQRARDVNPRFRLTAENAPAVAEICRRLDGLPLAIELAAARSNVLSPQALVQRLEHQLGLLTGGGPDLPPRQRTLRDAIAWSYGLLLPREQRLLRRLAVFEGGCSLPAVEAIGRDEGMPAVIVLDTLASLVDKNLVVRRDGADGEPRFNLLTTIREFARDQLAALGERAAAQQAHARHVLAFVEQREPLLLSPREPEASAQIVRELDNVRAAIRWSLNENDAELALRLVGALHMFFNRHDLSDGQRSVEAALALPGAQAPTALRARALYTAIMTASGLEEYDRARAFARECVVIWHTLGDPRREALALIGLALSLTDRGRAAEAAAQASARLCRASGYTWALTYALSALGATRIWLGDYDGAESALNEGVMIGRAIGERAGLGSPFFFLGNLALLRGDYALTRRHFAEGIACDRDGGFLYGVAYLEERLGVAALHAGDVDDALTHLRESLRLRRELGLMGGLVLCLDAVAQVAAALEQPRIAARLFGAAARRRSERRFGPHPVMDAARDAAVANVRATLGEEAFDAAWAHGAALTLEQAVIDALDCIARWQKQPDRPH